MPLSATYDAQNTNWDQIPQLLLDLLLAGRHPSKKLVDFDQFNLSLKIWFFHSTNPCRLPPCKSHFPLSLSA